MSMRFITAAFILAATTLFAVTAGSSSRVEVHERDTDENVRAKEIKMHNAAWAQSTFFETENGGGEVCRHTERAS